MALYLPHSSLGVMPSFNAWVSVAVPYSSVPQIYSVLLFLVPIWFGKDNRDGLGERLNVREYLVGAIGLSVPQPRVEYDTQVPAVHIRTQRASGDIPFRPRGKKLNFEISSTETEGVERGYLNFAGERLLVEPKYRRPGSGPGPVAPPGMTKLRLSQGKLHSRRNTPKCETCKCSGKRGERAGCRLTYPSANSFPRKISQGVSSLIRCMYQLRQLNGALCTGRATYPGTHLMNV